jgi:hypothetical protein
MNLIPPKVSLVIALVLVGGLAALKALAPLEPGWVWTATVIQLLTVLGTYLVVPGTQAQRDAHAKAAS